MGKRITKISSEQLFISNGNSSPIAEPCIRYSTAKNGKSNKHNVRCRNYLWNAVMIVVMAEAAADTAAAITDQSMYLAFKCIAEAESTAASAAMASASAAFVAALAASVSAFAAANVTPPNPLPQDTLERVYTEIGRRVTRAMNRIVTSSRESRRTFIALKKPLLDGGNFFPDVRKLKTY
jgi:hypothetical protein